jgi:hypothetical protein
MQKFLQQAELDEDHQIIKNIAIKNSIKPEERVEELNTESE